ncbi:uncharacterized protein LOC122293332 [Carya illinoinensis]|uniref:uncharacterized protein LOC122293332 n=1 Tax=Carya illinoinensis TaxID=32201 RepID=UPI001C71FE77|nr:uncharacterized protein LOC122293332 [Carya illinoinensis]
MEKHASVEGDQREWSRGQRGSVTCSLSKPTIILLFSFLALLILAVVLIIILAVKPKKPSFDLQQVGVQYMGINMPTLSTASAPETNPSTNPTTSAYLSLNIRMLFTAVNPNRVGIKYGESRFTVMYRGIPLGKASVPGFFQEAHSVRKVEATIAVDRVNLLQADAADLVRDASLNDRVELRVLGDVGAKIRVLNFDSPGVQHEASPENNTSSTFGFFQIINHGFRAGFEVGEGLGWVNEEAGDGGYAGVESGPCRPVIIDRIRRATSTFGFIAAVEAQYYRQRSRPAREKKKKKKLFHG